MDFHIDVVPGRFTDETKADAYLYQCGGDKKRLKTNLDVHLDHVRDSGVTDAILAADGTACVLLPDERWRLWPVGSPLLKYLTGPLHSFFLAQTMVDEGLPWPFGQWAHGARGVFQFYRELLKTSDLRVMTTYLDYLAAKKVKGHWPCPCRNGKKLRDCHCDQVKDLREKITRKVAERSLAILREAGESAIEMTEAKPPEPLI